MKFSLTTLTAALLLSASTTTHALSTMAQTCPAGTAAPPIGHGAGQETLLSERGFSVGTAGPLVVGEETTIVLTATDDAIPFRGFLIRLSTENGELEAKGPNVQMATVCGDVPGVTHVDSDSKTRIEATVIPMSAGPMVFDVSVVEANNRLSPGNIYSYSSIEFQVLGEEAEAPIVDTTTTVPTTNTSAPVATATAVPTSAPVATVVMAPPPVMVAAPNATVEIPVTASPGPNVTETTGNATAPSVNVTMAPVAALPVVTEAPVVAPVVETTEAPVAPPKEKEEKKERSSANSMANLSIIALVVGLVMMAM